MILGLLTLILTQSPKIMTNFIFQDQYDNLSFHTQKGIDFLERYGHFIRDRCLIEMEYAGKLRYIVYY